MKDNPMVSIVADYLMAGFFTFGSKLGFSTGEVLNALG